MDDLTLLDSSSRESEEIKQRNWR